MDVNYVCSLGTRCQTAQTLKRMNVKVCSYPFDWIYSNLNNIIHCIEDNFTIFLNKSYYISISPTICQHTYYYPKGGEYNMFNHYNPLIQKNYEYYIRCVNRFKHLLSRPQHKLFIIMFSDVYGDKDEIKKTVIEFNEKFSNFTSNYTLLAILNTPHKPQNHSFSYYNNVHFLDLYTKSNTNGLKFYEKNDNQFIDSILNKSYNFDLRQT